MNEVNTEVVVKEDNMPAPLSATAIRQQVNLIQQVMREVMQDKQHYGVVPGCGNKPTLLKPGAEKLAMTFRLRPIMDNTRDIVITPLENGHREVSVYCHIYNSQGMEMATGVGSCSTMEKKYRYRKGPNGQKEENPDVADTYNTVLKMAKKRAFVDGILSATAASDIFTQDIEDMDMGGNKTEEKPRQEMPQRSSAAPAEAPGPDCISEAQAKRFFAIYRGAGKTDDEAKAMLKEIYNIESSKQIKRADYEALCSWAAEPVEGKP